MQRNLTNSVTSWCFDLALKWHFLKNIKAFMFLIMCQVFSIVVRRLYSYDTSFKTNPTLISAEDHFDYYKRGLNALGFSLFYPIKSITIQFHNEPEKNPITLVWINFTIFFMHSRLKQMLLYIGDDFWWRCSILNSENYYTCVPCEVKQGKNEWAWPARQYRSYKSVNT
jgi:hypothetical protein